MVANSNGLTNGHANGYTDEFINGPATKGEKRLKVIIVGGSVAGLTLAHCLHHSNIDFVLLEARKEIAPQVGASIVVLPNGARVLDQ